eukprot:COSAG01_NODE_6452_length_3660_cov_2.580174_4_plen_293_part_00
MTDQPMGPGGVSSLSPPHALPGGTPVKASTKEGYSASDANAMRILRHQNPRKGGKKKGGPRAPGAAIHTALLLLLRAAGCAASSLAGAADDADLINAGSTRADGWLVPECQAATTSWLHHVATMGHAQDRVAARQLLGSGLFQLPTHNSSSSTVAQEDQNPGDNIVGSNLTSEDPSTQSTKVWKHRPVPVLGTGEGRQMMHRGLHAAAPNGDIANDGPALRAALVPTKGMEGQWEQELKWPADKSANPCTTSQWRGVTCSDGRVYRIDLSGITLPAYYMGSAIRSLTGLSIM